MGSIDFRVFVLQFVENFSEAVCMANKKAKNKRAIRQPGNSELEVLRVLWEHGGLNVRQVATHLEAAGLSWADTTIHTLLTRMRNKRLVAAKKQDGVLVFSALIGPEEFGGGFGWPDFGPIWQRDDVADR